MKDALTADGHPMIDRMAAHTPEEQDEMWRRQVSADWFFMSDERNHAQWRARQTSDGNANRLALLLHGPQACLRHRGHEQGRRPTWRAASNASTPSHAPLNAARLHTNTPCELTGVCANCHAEGCMCCQEVITRHSRHEGRIHVILVGEDLGY